jgi:hypothetical protein
VKIIVLAERSSLILRPFSKIGRVARKYSE